MPLCFSKGFWVSPDCARIELSATEEEDGDERDSILFVFNECIKWRALYLCPESIAV